MDINHLLALIQATNSNQRITMYFQWGVLLVLVISMWLIIVNLRERNRTLKDSLTSMERILKIIRLDEIEKYVDMSRKTFDMEKNEAIRKIKEETNKGLEFQLKEYGAVLGFSLSIVDSVFLPAIDELLNRMENSISKDNLLKARERYRARVIELFKDAPIASALLIEWLNRDKAQGK